MILITVVITLITVADAGAVDDITDEQYLSFPRLFYLDEYEECLRRKDAVFCLGTFHVTPQPQHQQYNTNYRLMKRYSEDILNFNRTRVHRGYCLSTRCASVQGGTPAQTPAVWFDKCAAKWGARRGLNLRLESLQYCHDHQQYREKSQWRVERTHRVFLTTLAVILALNVLGTLYYILGGKWQPLAVWSTFDNFLRLFKPDSDDGGPRSSLTLDGGKVLLMWFVIFMNAGSIHTKLYLQNTRYLEQIYHHPIVQYLLTSNLPLHVVVMVSSFTLAENVLKERRSRLTHKLFLKLLLRQILRIYPVYLFSVMYASSWWVHSRGGPQWHHVEHEAHLCQDKFWSIALFVDNFTNDNRQCLNTWLISVYMQIYIVCSVLMVCLVRMRRPHTVLAVLLFGSCTVTAVAAYIRDWKPLVVIGGPENICNMYSEQRTYREWYIKPWGSVAPALTGLALAFSHKHLAHRRYNISQHKWVSMLSQLSFPVLLLWASVGRSVCVLWGRTARALWLALDPLTTCLLVAVIMVQLYNMPQKRKSSVAQKQRFLECFMSWWMWYPLSRVSLTMLTWHGFVNTIIAYSRPALYNVTLIQWIVDFVGTASFAYLAAAPVTLLLDMPLQRLFDVFIQLR